MDRISKLPEGIIGTILCLLPLQEAARTSILSKEWRYHWTKIPKLEFDEDTFQVSMDKYELFFSKQTFSRPSKRKQKTKRCKLFHAIYQVLLTHQGPIYEFSLSMRVDKSCVEINHIILHLSKRNTVKALKLDLSGRYALPLSFCSLQQLTTLHLKNCSLDRLQLFNGFGCLTNLRLQQTYIRVETLLCLLSSCPLLTRFTLDSISGSISDTEDSTIVDLFKCLPVIEYLYVPCYIIQYFVPKRIPKELPTTLINLKCLRVYFVCVSRKYDLHFLALLFRSSPNLEKLQLHFGEYCLEDDECSFSTREDYLDFTLEHLNELELLNNSHTDGELAFVQLISAKSPMLKNVRVVAYPRD